uniref:(northern house mosquito) hypothetical protein n=1 Tax=Culex pipiens TaxID=7175 RepID=A0A8D8CBP1_CULPI
MVDYDLLARGVEVVLQLISPTFGARVPELLISSGSMSTMIYTIRCSATTAVPTLGWVWERGPLNLQIARFVVFSCDLGQVVRASLKLCYKVKRNVDSWPNRTYVKA